MMETLLSRGINDKGTFNVQLTGGSPWGFTLHGGSEFGSKLCISKITPGGKADKTKVLRVGDEVASINNMECSARAEAIEQVRCSRQSLKLTIRRENSRQNGIQERSNEHHPLPNLYKTALEVVVEPNNFYETYSVDPAMYARIALHSKEKQSNLTKNDLNELSASNEDLLERYRNSESTKMKGSDETLDRITKSYVANGRLSPAQDPNTSGQSLPETQIHGRTNTSPGRIQKVKIISSNILSSSSTFSSPDDDSSRPQSRLSPAKHSPIARQQRVTESEARSSDHDNWFEQWLKDDKPHVTPEENVSVKDARTKFEQDEHKSPNKPNEHKSRLSRSKSMSAGRPSYGVVFGTTAVKAEDHSAITAFQAPLPPARYSSSDLLREATDSREAPPEPLRLRAETSPHKATPVKGDRNQSLELRLSRRSLGAPPMVSSTSSLDAFSNLDPRRQGPAPPPRRSESKLLNSFRVRGKRTHLHSHTVTGTPREKLSNDVGHFLKEVPNHVASRSWPSEHDNNQPVPSKETDRKSWHSQLSDDNRPEGQFRKPSETGLKSSSVIIRSMRSSSSSLDSSATTPKIYRTSSVELRPEIRVTEAMRPQSERSLARPELEQQNQRVPDETQSLTKRIEETHILQKLMKGNEVQSIRSRIQTFEKSSSQPSLVEVPDDLQLRQPSHHPKQRSWDQSYSSSDRQLSNSKTDSWRAVTKAPPENRDNRVAQLEHVVVPMEKESKGQSPVKVTPVVREVEKRELIKPDGEKEDRLQRSSAVISKPRKEATPVKESITRSQSKSVQEREVHLDEMFRKLEESSESNPPSNSKTEWNNNNAIDKPRDSRTSVVSMGEDDVFLNTSNDDSLPLPPPPSYGTLETSHDNFSLPSPPLPTPPREILARDTPLKIVANIDRKREIIEVKAIEHTIQRLMSPRMEHINNVDDDKRNSFLEEKLVYKLNAEKSNREDTRKEEEVESGANALDHHVYKDRAETVQGENIPYEENTPYGELKAGSGPSSPWTDSSEDRHSSADQSIDISLDTGRPEERTVRTIPSPLVITSTPTSLVGNDVGDEQGESVGSPLSGSSLSTPSSSRPGSMMSPKLEALDREKGELVNSMKKKIEDLRAQMNEISDEIAENEKLGEKVTGLLEGKTTPAEFSKYQRFTGELNKIVLLLLSLTQRMHRYENTLQELDMSEEADRQQRDILLEKIDHVKGQYQEACIIKGVNDKRGETVSKFLENYLDEDEFADFQYYIDMKTQLALMHAEIRDKVKMGEERLNTLTTTAIDWNTISLCSY